MSHFFPKRTFSRRDMLMALTGRLRQDATPRAPTGRDPKSKAIDRLIDQNQLEEAIAGLHALLKKSPDHVQAERKLGYCLLQAGRLSEAGRVFEAILARHPHDVFALLHLGLALTRQDRLAEAISVWRRYMNTDQPVIQRALNLQIALYETGGPSSPEQVAENIQQAIAEQQTLDQTG
ncbi:MAG: tetratricopeptide repeat protein [Desulfovermiculus sp.]